MEIKPELKDGLKRAIGSTFKIHFGCVKDKDGVPIPFHLTHCELKDEFIISLLLKFQRFCSFK
jgi:hypothetical protein